MTEQLLFIKIRYLLRLWEASKKYKDQLLSWSFLRNILSVPRDKSYMQHQKIVLELFKKIGILEFKKGFKTYFVFTRELTKKDVLEIIGELLENYEKEK